MPVKRSIRRHLALFRGVESVVGALEPAGVETVRFATRASEDWPKADLLTTMPLWQDDNQSGRNTYAALTDAVRDGEIDWTLIYGCGAFLHGEVMSVLARWMAERGRVLSYNATYVDGLRGRTLVPIVFGPHRIEVPRCGFQVPEGTGVEIVPADLTLNLVGQMNWGGANAY